MLDVQHQPARLEQAVGLADDVVHGLVGRLVQEHRRSYEVETAVIELRVLGVLLRVGHVVPHGLRTRMGKAQDRRANIDADHRGMALLPGHNLCSFRCRRPLSRVRLGARSVHPIIGSWVLLLRFVLLQEDRRDRA